MHSELLTGLKHMKKCTRCISRIRWPRKSTVPPNQGIKPGDPQHSCNSNWHWMQKATKLSRDTSTTNKRPRKAPFQLLNSGLGTKERLTYSMSFSFSLQTPWIPRSLCPVAKFRERKNYTHCRKIKLGHMDKRQCPFFSSIPHLSSSCLISPHDQKIHKKQFRYNIKLRVRGQRHFTWVFSKQYS